MKLFFDYDNIETDDYSHPLDPDDSTHSRLLTVYCHLEATNEEIQKYIEDRFELTELILKAKKSQDFNDGMNVYKKLEEMLK